MMRLQLVSVVMSLFAFSHFLFGAVISVEGAAVQKGLSPYNWVCKSNCISSTVCGASMKLAFIGTRMVSLRVDSDNLVGRIPGRCPIIAWSVNDGEMQSHQLCAGESNILLSAEVKNPSINLYLKGMSPFEDRYSGDFPTNAVKITGFIVEGKARVVAGKFPKKIWLNIGDSIMSGDGALLAPAQGRPARDGWAASDDGRASYGYLLAQHYNYRESRIAYGGYDWKGGLAQIPALSLLIDQRTSTITRLSSKTLKPAPDVVLINLGENGVPSENEVSQALLKIRQRVKRSTKIIVMIPVSGKGRTEITRFFYNHQKSSGSDNTYLVDLGPLEFATCDGQHPTLAGHQAIYDAALPAMDKIMRQK